jgi:hypothetical protein
MDQFKWKIMDERDGYAIFLFQIFMTRYEIKVMSEQAMPYA